MFVYEKKLQYPVRIKAVNPELAAKIISQYGGPDCKPLQSLRRYSAFHSPALISGTGNRQTRC